MRWVLIVTSFVGHFAAVVGLDQIEPAASAPAVVPIVFQEAPAFEPEPEPSPLDPPPEASPNPLPQANSAPVQTSPASPSPPSALPSPPSLDSVQDLGLELSGTSAGLAVASGTGTGNLGSQQTAAPTRRVLGPDAKLGHVGTPSCDEPAAKPRLTHLPQPAYTDAARAAGISGKVRISITVGLAGRVEQASVLQSLGHGLDEAALAAARAATFEPALRCGKPSTSTFTISVRFTAD